MKNIVLIIAVLVACVTGYSASVESLPGGAKAGNWYDSISVAPIGAVKTLDLTERSQWGAGLRLGYKVNDYVSVLVDNTAFEGTGESRSISEGKGGVSLSNSGPDKWGGTAIDETDLLVKAKLASYKDEKLSLYGIGGGLRDWDLQTWGFQAGAGVELALGKHASLFSEYSLQALFKDENGSSKRSLVKFGIGISF